MYARPTAPLSIGGVVDDAIKLYRASFRRCVPVALLGSLVMAAFGIFVIEYARHAGLALTGPGVTEKGFISFAARKSAGRRTGLTAAKVMKPCSELNRRRRVGL